MNKLNTFMRRVNSMTSTRAALAFFIIFFLFAMLIILMFKEVPNDNKSMLEMALGSLMTVGFAVVISYYFGSSKNESDKTRKDTVTELMKEDGTIQ